MKRALVLTALLATTLAGCGNSDPSTVSSPASGTPSASATEGTDAGPASGSCQASGTGTTDLKTKPVYATPAVEAPAKTTTVDVVCGTGAEVKQGSAVTAKYVGVNYKTGEEFDSSWKVSADNTFEFTVGQGVIPGFSIGVLGMKEGGRRLVVIPPVEGYGDAGPVPGGALAFIIDLVKVTGP